MLLEGHRSEALSAFILIHELVYMYKGKWHKSSLNWTEYGYEINSVTDLMGQGMKII
jgi:hypothetical protein